MKKIILIIYLVLATVSVSASENTLKNFTTTISVLNQLTVKYHNTKHDFSDKNYSDFNLYKALILNEFIMHGVEDDELSQFFCKDYKNQTLNLLKWKILNTHELSKINGVDNDCIEKHQTFSNVIYKLMNEDGYGEANIELYRLTQETSKSQNANNIHMLLPAIYAKPDIEILELLMMEYKKFGLDESEWQTTILAARYGSQKAIMHLLELINTDEKDFLKMIISLFDI